MGQGQITAKIVDKELRTLSAKMYKKNGARPQSAIHKKKDNLSHEKDKISIIPIPALNIMEGRELQ